uniref:Secreted protein n=1 Tax=Ascaris lumbricoides TaxID=6252 RepID=A0A9J2PB34_ASCLU
LPFFLLRSDAVDIYILFFALYKCVYSVVFFQCSQDNKEIRRKCFRKCREQGPQLHVQSFKYASSFYTNNSNELMTWTPCRFGINTTHAAKLIWQPPTAVAILGGRCDCRVWNKSCRHKHVKAVMDYRCIEWKGYRLRELYSCPH